MRPDHEQALNLPYSKSLAVGDLLLMSGHVPLDGNGQIVSTELEAQFDHVLGGIVDTLSQHGATLDQLVQLRCYLSDERYFAEFNRLCSDAFEAPFPTRTTIVAKMAMPGILIEIEPTAALTGRRDGMERS
jgi:2-iminobutanoate/2-iminopropanoate deaminase